jgi:mannose-6-phosphate isomerase
MIPLAPGIRDYDWGTRGEISRLLGRTPTDRLEAELWIGAHPGFPTPTLDGGSVAERVASNPVAVLGEGVADKFGGRLPFLVKVLAAGRPLSVQVHPTPEQARRGFAEEDARGVPRDAPHRNYVDDQAKPEMMVALKPMRALAGFRDPANAKADLVRLLGAPGGFAVWEELHSVLSEADHAQALRGAMSLLLTGGAGADELVRRLVEAASVAPADDSTASVVRLLAEHHPGDRGIAVGALLNHVQLAPGEAVFLGAGTPHAYLQGLGVEVMSTSDNVLRGGLTTKHIDVAELLRIVQPAATAPHRLVPEERAVGDQVFRVPVGDFQLQRLHSTAASEFEIEHHGPVVVLVVAGTAVLRTEAATGHLERGHSVLLPAQERAPRLSAGPGGVLAFAATVGTCTGS